jgi:hypothetical protein
MKPYAIAAVLLLTLTGCATASEPTDTTAPSASESASPSESGQPTNGGVDLSAEFNPSQEALESLISNLMNSCDKGLAEGMSEVGNGARVVILPESESYESYSAFYELEDGSYSELVFSLDFSSACALPMSASNYGEGTMDENGNIDWDAFPVKVEQIDENRFRVLDASAIVDETDQGFESVYVFENGLLISQEIEDFSVTVNYGGWTEGDKETLKVLVDELFADQ